MKQSKERPFLFPLLLLIAAGFGLTSCSGNDFTDDESVDGQRFGISVTDGGYSPAPGDIHTRTAEQAYRTEFTAGDRIGVFAVKNNQIITEVNNLCLTAIDAGGTLEWKDDGNKALSKFSGATYYAYYPYQETPTGSVDPTATDAATFFAGVISAWAPASDQGTYAKYTAQDLMVAKGSMGSNGLLFPMQHQMALAVIGLPGTKYEFSNTDPSVSDYIAYPRDIQFDNYSPCRMTDGTYRYLVNPAPGSATSTLSGGYTDASDAAKGWEVNTTAIYSGSYRRFHIDGGMTYVFDYNLQIGDYMLKDGTLVSKDASLSPTQKANCIGVVFWIDPDGIDHGKIVSLDQLTYKDWADYGYGEIDMGTSMEDGLVNIQLMADYIYDNNVSWSNFPIFEWIHNTKNGGNADYRNTTTRLWYPPSWHELQHLYCAYNDQPCETWEWSPSWSSDNTPARTAFNSQLTNAGGSALNNSAFASSSEDTTVFYGIRFLNGATVIAMKRGGGIERSLAIAKF